MKGFYFFDSYRSALCKYQEANDLESQVFLIHAMCDYIFDGKTPETFPRPDLQVVWELLIPSLDRSREIEETRQKKSEAGRKGGEANRKQNGSKKEAKEKQKGSTPEANAKPNKNKNKNKNIYTGRPAEEMIPEEKVIEYYMKNN